MSRLPQLSDLDLPAGAHGLPKRHQEILRAGLELLAERGYGGTSLRELARRVGIQQPSLYHYFRSKEDLVDQIIDAYAGEMLRLPLERSLPTRLEEFPAYVRDLVFSLYEQPTHPLFVRVAFAVSRSHPRFGPHLRELFVDRTQALMRPMVEAYVADTSVTVEDALHLLRMVINAIGFRLMEERVLFDEQPLSDDVRAFADFVVDAAETQLRSLRRRRGGGT